MYYLLSFIYIIANFLFTYNIGLNLRLRSEMVGALVQEFDDYTVVGMLIFRNNGTLIIL